MVLSLIASQVEMVSISVDRQSENPFEKKKCIRMEFFFSGRPGGCLGETETLS